MGTPKRRGPGKYDRTKSAEQRRHEQRRRLLAAATTVFAREGYAQATVADIIAEAGVSRQTFYEHFRDLRDALLQLYDHAAGLLFRDVEKRLREIEDPTERLETGVTGFLLLLGEHADLARVLTREILAAGPEHAARREAVLSRFSALLTEGIAEAYALGRISRPADEMTVYALVCAMEGVGMRYLQRGEEDRIGEAAPMLVALVQRAFR